MTFTDSQALLKHYAEVRRRLWSPAIDPPKAKVQSAVAVEAAPPVVRPPVERGPQITFRWGNRTYSVGEDTSRFTEAFPEHAAPTKYPRVSVIKTVVAKHYGIAVIDIDSSRRTANIVLPRHVAVYLTKELTLNSLPEIGRRFGNRDHTTALNSIRKIRFLVEKDAEFSLTIEKLKQQIFEAGR